MDMNGCINKLITEMDYKEGIKVKHVIDKFEKKVKQGINSYIDKSGLDDYKMNEYDYIVLYILWKIVDVSDCIEECLIILYSYYKIEEFYFSANKFKTKNVINLLANKEMTSVLNVLINNIV